MNPNNLVLRNASILGGTAVIILALAAHSLKNILEPSTVDSISTAAEIQLFHALALLALSVMTFQSERSFIRICRLMTLGVLLFSGSIYILAFKSVLGLPWLKYFGPITPLGGVCMIVSWFMLLRISMLMNSNSK
jgi:uncharacterized membrane protein YgdD (TMEM256/DUF423 family)